MLSDFESAKPITLRPGDVKQTYEFKIRITSSRTANDGSIPYGTTVTSVVTTACNSSDVDITSTMLPVIPTEADNIITVKLTYPGTDGRYYLKFICTLSDESVKQLIFGKIKAESD